MKNQNGFLLETPGFNQGLDYYDYVEKLKQSKIVICPGGAATPDTFRVFEALECGCVPIIDAQSGRGYSTVVGNYWQKVFGKDFPVPVITNWADLERYINDILEECETYQEIAHNWWDKYKGFVAFSFKMEVERLKIESRSI